MYRFKGLQSRICGILKVGLHTRIWDSVLESLNVCLNSTHVFKNAIT